MTRLGFLLRTIVGGVALVAWLLFFSTGLLVETGKYRRFLAPEAYASQSAAQSATQSATSPGLPRHDGGVVSAFLLATLFYTPTNLLFLTLLAGLLGGCSSNLVAESLREHGTEVGARRLMYMEEHPWSAMMRGFVVYLAFIAGLYFIIDDPFENPTAAQYMRLAGTLSIFAFIVGYDPSRISQFLRLPPLPQPKQTVTIHADEEGVELKAEQRTTNPDDEQEEPARERALFDGPMARLDT